MEKVFFTKGIYGSGMVLQQNRVGSIFGKAKSGSNVNLEFREIKKSVVSDAQGNWKIEFDPGSAGGPYELKLSSSDDIIIYTDVYVGEVWVCSGQSNAQLPMERLYYKYKDEFSLPENPYVRIFTVPISYSFDGEKDFVDNPKWVCANPETLGKISGSSYWFAKTLSENLKVPVGIVNASQGGSPIEAWMDYQSLADLNKKSLLEKVDLWKIPGKIENKKEEVLKAQQIWDSELNNQDKGTVENWEKLSFDEICGTWKDCEIPGDINDLGTNAGVIWFKKEFELSDKEVKEFNSKKTHLWMGTIQDADKIWINETFCGVTYYTYPPRRYVVPTGSLKVGKNTITIRVQKNGSGPIRFYKEKPYCLYTDGLLVQPSSTRNLEHFDYSKSKPGIKIMLDGNWKKCISCEKNVRPGEIFFEWEPTALFNSMLAPAFNYAISGFMWYQGESNAGAYYEYKDLLSKMIELWREKFIYSPKNMPAIIAQLPNWANGFGKDFSSEIEDWAELRYAQKSCVDELENTGLAVLIDAGEWNDLHPESKKTVGERTAKEALRIAYKKDFSEPAKVDYCQKDGRKFIIRFDCGDAELKSYLVKDDIANFDVENSEIFGFEVLSEHGNLYSAKAKLISGTDVEVEMPDKVILVKELRYLWKNNPWIVNLYTSENIPVVPFRIRLS